VAIWSHLDDLWLATSADGLTWDGPVNVPLPVNSAHNETSPSLIQDEAGRYCLIFLSDRGMLRRYFTYASWSKDLTNWSRPVVVDSTYHTDHALIQAIDGRYVIASITYFDSKKRFITLHTSADFRQWSQLATMAEFGNVKRVAIAQDHYGSFHLAWTWSNKTVHAASEDLVRWTDVKRVAIEAYWPKGSVTVGVVGERLVVGTGAEDRHYSGRETTHLASRPLRAAQPEWTSIKVPKHVLDVYFDFVYDPATDDVLFVWQTSDQSLDTTQPSGPVFALKGRRSKWFAEQPGDSP
jgi:hypothetical protein